MSERFRPISEAWVGPMRAGKTEEMLRALRRDEIANRRVALFKAEIDQRWGYDVVHSRSGLERQATAVLNHEYPESCLPFVLDLETGEKLVDVVAFEEAQFFDAKIVAVGRFLNSQGIRTYYSGLELDFRGEPFGPMPNILADTSLVHKLTAICEYSGRGVFCGELAERTQRLIDGMPANYEDPIIMVGDQEYVPRCREHHFVPHRPVADFIPDVFLRERVR